MLFFVALVNLTYAASLIQPVVIIGSYNSTCVGVGECCACSKYSGCSANKTCTCSQDQSGNQMYGQSCLLNSLESAAVDKQTVSGADETLISSFTVLQVYDLLKRDVTLTYKQLYAIYTLGVSLASTSVQQSEIDWYLRNVQLITKKLALIVTLETSTQQTFQIQIMDLIRSLMFKYIDLDTKKQPFFYELGYYSAIIANWKDTINYSTMKVNSVSLKSAQCDYKYKSVLIKYKFILAISKDMIGSFTNSSFIFNSTVTYCQYMDKYGAIYYPPSSEFHYWHYIPNYDYEPLLNVTDVIGLGCFQIKSSNSVYGLTYNDQECQYKGVTTTRLVPYCQCNEPGITFVQVLWSDKKIASLALTTGTTNATTTESYSILIMIVNLLLLILL